MNSNVNGIPDLREIRDRQHFAETAQIPDGYRKREKLIITKEDIDTRELKGLDYSITCPEYSFEIFTTTNEEFIVRLKPNSTLETIFIQEQMEIREEVKRKRALKLLLEVIERAEKKEQKKEEKKQHQKENWDKIKRIPKTFSEAIKSFAH